VVGRDFASVALANIGGCLALVAVAAACEWFKSSPWAHARKAAPHSAALPHRARTA
jgi:hypothetical protein